MASAVFLLDSKGQSILSRDYRGEVWMSQVPEKFSKFVVNADPADVKPVFCDDGVTYCWLKQNDIYALAVTRLHANVAMLLSFLAKVCELFTIYYSKFEEESIRDNFVISYELLDEIMDNGIPQLTEPKILAKVITTSNKQMHSETAKTPSSITTAVSWRAEGIKHKKNEIFLDVIEKIDCLVSANNQVLRSDILGVLRMKSFLSGMPELKLGLNDKNLMEGSGVERRGTTVELEDIRFHHCVRLIKFENDGTISFVPPDGEFDLMSYRLPNALDQQETQLPFWVECTLGPTSKDPNASRVEYVIKIKSTFKPRSVASSVELTVPGPEDASNPSFKTSSGSVKFHPDKKCFVWTLKSFQGQREQLLTATLSRPTVGHATPETDVFYKRPMELKFDIPFFTLSGINVRYLKIFEASGYQALPWVRYITQNGFYQVRMS